MAKNPRHKALLMTGVVLLVATPFAAYFLPSLLRPLLCPLLSGPDPAYKPILYEAFKCVTADIWTGIVTFIIFAAAGTALVLYSLRQSK